MHLLPDAQNNAALTEWGCEHTAEVFLAVRTRYDGDSKRCFKWANFFYGCGFLMVLLIEVLAHALQRHYGKVHGHGHAHGTEQERDALLAIEITRAAEVNTLPKANGHSHGHNNGHSHGQVETGARQGRAALAHPRHRQGQPHSGAGGVHRSVLPLGDGRHGHGRFEHACVGHSRCHLGAQIAGGLRAGARVPAPQRLAEAAALVGGRLLAHDADRNPVRPAAGRYEQRDACGRCVRRVRWRHLPVRRHHGDHPAGAAGPAVPVGEVLCSARGLRRHGPKSAAARTADAPGHCALLAGGRRLVGLALDAQVHDVVAADGAVVHHDVCAADINNNNERE
ncbi:hypothetical protein ON010_g17914 [Phytophthora cinnamomi]|nr:hypothetical protein ON010_g17914 [Phytophthora cinnamomi]